MFKKKKIEYNLRHNLLIIRENYFIDDNNKKGSDSIEERRQYSL
jgi:hypothetical protein